MAVAAVKQRIAEQLDELQKTNGSIDPDNLVGVVEAVIDSLEGDMTAVGLKVYADIEALARYINTARAEIADLCPYDINSEHLTEATDDLTANVGALEQSTHQLFEVAAGIDQQSDVTGERVSELVEISGRGYI